jgi:hypothetical protein
MYLADVDGHSEPDYRSPACQLVMPPQSCRKVRGERVDEHDCRDVGRRDDQYAIALVFAVARSPPKARSVKRSFKDRVQAMAKVKPDVVVAAGVSELCEVDGDDSAVHAAPRGEPGRMTATTSNTDRTARGVRTLAAIPGKVADCTHGETSAALGHAVTGRPTWVRCRMKACLPQGANADLEVVPGSGHLIHHPGSRFL